MQISNIHGGYHDDAIEVHPVMRLQIVDQGGRSECAVTFPNEEFRRIPAIVPADVCADELRQGPGILIDTPEILILGFAFRMAEAGADGIDEYEIGGIQQAVLIVGELVGRRRRRFSIRSDHPPGAKGTHVQPDRGGPGPPVIEKRDRPLAQVLQVVPAVGNEKDTGVRLAFLILQKNRRS